MIIIGKVEGKVDGMTNCVHETGTQLLRRLGTSWPKSQPLPKPPLGSVTEQYNNAE